MLIFCPNCEAQYKISDDVLPPEGRDVECSNCNWIWFQPHPDYPRHGRAERSPAAQNRPRRAAQSAPAPAASSEAGSRAQTPPPPPPAPEPAQQNASPKRELDPAVVDILRSEAQFEQEARAKEAPQPEYDKDASFEQGRDTQQQTTITPRASERTSRLGLLPDIEKINSSLDADPASEGADIKKVPSKNVTDQRKSRKGRWGFLTACALVAIAVAIYVFGPQIIELRPELGPYLAQYTASINEARETFNAGVAVAQERGGALWQELRASLESTSES